MAETLRILVLDDDHNLGELLQSFLKTILPCKVDLATHAADFWKQIADNPYDLLFIDYKLPGTTGLNILSELIARQVGAPAVMMTGAGDERIAAQAIQRGAVDYLIKGGDLFSSLPAVVHKAIAVRDLRRSVARSLEQIRYQALLLNNIREAIVGWDVQGRITFWNPAAQTLYGSSEAEMIGQPVAQVFLPLFTPSIDLPDPENTAGMEVERQYPTQSGETLWVSSRTSVLRDFNHSRQVLGYIHIAHDITRRKKEQQALKESRHFAQRIVDTTPSILYIYDLEQRRLVFLNSKISEIAGVSPTQIDQITPNLLRERVHPEDYPRLAEHYLRIRAHEAAEALEIEYRIQDAEQRWRWIKSREAVFWRSPEGLPQQIIGVADDITARKEAEDRLRQSEARYRAIVDEHQTEFICRFLPDATLTFVNEAYCHYAGKRREELLGTDFLKWALPEYQKHIQGCLLSLTAEQPAATCEYQVQFSGEDVRWHEWTYRAIFDKRGHFLEFQAVGRDITERKEMEAKIQSAQAQLAQQSRLAAIGELAASVAHQINNPLTTIIADAQIMLQKLEANHPGRESAEAVVKAGWRAQGVVEELLNFSQPPSDSLEAVAVNQTVEHALLLVEAHLRASGIELSVELADGLPPVYGSFHQLEDLWVNLLLQARAAAASDSPRRVHIRSRLKDAQWIVVEITDDGYFIPPEQIETIFEPCLVPTASGLGSGMELSICREIVRQNRGMIHAHSSYLGTTFEVSLPTEEISYGNGQYPGH